MNYSLADKHALVCGASEGIGRATAFALAAMGANVTVLARRLDKLDEPASLIETKKRVHELLRSARAVHGIRKGLRLHCDHLRPGVHGLRADYWTVSANWKIGRYIRITMPPTTQPMKIIITGSISRTTRSSRRDSS